PRLAKYGCAILGRSMLMDCRQSLFQQVSPAPDCQSVCKSLDHALARAECWRLLTLLSRVQIGINACRRLYPKSRVIRPRSGRMKVAQQFTAGDRSARIGSPWSGHEA